MPESLAANAAAFACIAFALVVSGCISQESTFSLDCVNASNYTACLDTAADYIRECTPVQVYALSNGSSVILVGMTRQASGGCTVRASVEGVKVPGQEHAHALATGDSMTCSFQPGELADFGQYVDSSHCRGIYFDKRGALGLEPPPAPPADDGMELSNHSCGPGAAVVAEFYNGGDEDYGTSGILIYENHLPSGPGSLEWSMGIYGVDWSDAEGNPIDYVSPKGTALCTFTCNAGSFGGGPCSYKVQFRDGRSARFSC